MKTIKPWMVLLTGLTLSIEVRAQYVTVDADLIVKPGPDWSRVRNKIVIAPNANLPDMRYEEPYPSEWNNVQATVMTGLTVRVENIADNEALVEMRWDSPGILVYDLVLADGKCFGVNWRLPQGGWRAQGRILYNPAQNSIGWQEFSFFNEAVGSPTVNLGDCNLSIARMEQLSQDLLRQTIDPSWMAPLVRRAILEWTEVKKGAGPELLDSQTLALTDCVSMTWQPAEIRELPNGMWRIPGRISLTSTSHNFNFGIVARTEAENTLNNLTSDTLVLPVNAIETVAAATARNRGFHGFIPGMEHQAFKRLFTNRKLQNMEWEDLKAFPLETPFLFHVSVHGPVTLSDRKSNAKGLNFAHKSALTVAAKVHVLNQWFPYFDFMGIEEGRAQVGVNGGAMTLDLTLKSLDLRSYLRDEFAQVRTADPFTNMDLLNPRFDKMLSQHQFSFPLPRWRVGTGQELILSGINDSPRSLRLPLALGPQGPLPYGSVLRIVDVP